jgi:S-adenosylmethionine/arginine decarboxylase-like enzyme
MITLITPYGQELILDIHNCKVVFTRDTIQKFVEQLCLMIDMEREDLVFWDYAENPEEYDNAPAHLKGTSAVQFIRTSNITIHSLDELRQLYLNIFSCKSFEPQIVEEFVQKWSGGQIINSITITRI